jgi:hypothetical protein
MCVCVIIITKGYKVWGIGLTPIVHVELKEICFEYKIV